MYPQMGQTHLYIHLWPPFNCNNNLEPSECTWHHNLGVDEVKDSRALK